MRVVCQICWQQENTKTTEWAPIKLGGRMGSGPSKNFDADPDKGARG